MANGELHVAPRTVLGKKVAALRRSGMTPANIFGHKIESTAVQADTAALTHLLRGSTKNAIINLKVEGEPAVRTVVIRDVMRDSLTDKFLHIDFYQVSMTEKMRADVRLVLVGTSSAVETFGGVLLHTLDTVAVEALPGDIPTEFEVDVSRLTELDQSLHVRDLSVDAERVTIQTDPDVVVARVAAPRLATAEETPAAEGAVPAEGVPAPAGEETESS